MSEPGADAMDDGAASRPPGDMLSVDMLYSASSIPLPTTYNVDTDSGVQGVTHKPRRLVICCTFGGRFLRNIPPGIL